MKLFIDDERDVPGVLWNLAKTSAEAIELLEDQRAAGAAPDYNRVSFDHDLGGDDTTMPVVEWMIETGYWPATVIIHTANPVGRENIFRAIDAEAPAWVTITVPSAPLMRRRPRE